MSCANCLTHWHSLNVTEFQQWIDFTLCLDLTKTKNSIVAVLLHFLAFLGFLCLYYARCRENTFESANSCSTSVLEYTFQLEHSNSSHLSMMKRTSALFAAEIDDVSWNVQWFRIDYESFLVLQKRILLINYDANFNVKSRPNVWVHELLQLVRMSRVSYAEMSCNQNIKFTRKNETINLLNAIWMCFSWPREIVVAS